MRATVPALLDVEQALQAFRATVTPLLEVGAVAPWDGSRFRERESAIHWAALVLAGQCIALLLWRLAQSAAAQAEAAQRTRPLRTGGSYSHGQRRVTVVTVGNVSVTLALAYVLIQPPKGAPAAARGFYPFLKWLGLEEGLTPLVWTTVAEYGLVQTSFAVARDLLQAWGITVSAKRVARLTYQFGAVGLAQRAQQVAQLAEGPQPSGTLLTGQRVVISVDGGRTRLRVAKRGRRRASGRHGYVGEWKEPKVLTIYVVDAEGHKVNTAALPVTNDGTFAGVEAFMALLEMHLLRLGIAHAAHILVLADGAAWIWERLPALLARLGCPPARVREVVDFYHTTTHLADFAEAAFPKAKAAQAWLKKACARLKRGHAAALVQEMQTLAAKAPHRQRALLTQALNFLANQLHRLDYAQVAALKLPIGSGAVESLLRQVVNLRLKGTGKFWLQDHAEILLHARCQWAAGQWPVFCTAVLTANIGPS